jgi:autotransporter-associated beta strand protein
LFGFQILCKQSPARRILRWRIVPVKKGVGMVFRSISSASPALLGLGAFVVVAAAEVPSSLHAQSVILGLGVGVGDGGNGGTAAGSGGAGGVVLPIIPQSSTGQTGALNGNGAGGGGGGGAAGGFAGGDGGGLRVAGDQNIGRGGTAPGANGANGTSLSGRQQVSGTGGGGGAGGANGSGVGTAQSGGNGGGTNFFVGEELAAGGGGGGGAGGFGNVISFSSGATAAAASFGGGNGGGGGSSSPAGVLAPVPLPGTGGGGSGDGGSGGVALVMNNPSPHASYTIGSGLSLRGGDGGTGGSSTLNNFVPTGGNGGAGGAGIAVTRSGGLTITNAGTIKGGNGGEGGSDSHFMETGGFGSGIGIAVPGVSGADGSGGEGINGANLTIINSGVISGGVSGDGTVRANAVTFSAGTNSLTITSSSVITGNVVAASTADTFGLGGAINATFNLAQLGAAASAVQYQGFGILQKSGTSTWTVTGTPGTPLAYQVTGGALDLNGATQAATSFLLTGGTLQNGTLTSTAFDVQAGTVSAALAGTGGVTKTTAGTVTLSGANTFTGGTTLTSGTLTIGDNSALGTGTLAMAAGTTLSFANTGNFTIANNVTVSGDPIFMPPTGTTQTISGAISDGSSPGVVDMLGPGTLVLSGANTYSGGTLVEAGTLQLSGAGTLGATTGTLAVSGLLDLGTTSQTTGALTLTGGTIQNGTLTSSSFGVQAGTVSAVLAGAGGVTKTTAGTVIFSGTNSYTGATNINGGILEVDGSIATSSLTSVNANASLTGIGTVGNTQISAGGIFAPGSGTPGSSMTVAGNLAFQSGAIYLVQVNPATASLANVTGTATLGNATVSAVFAPGSSVINRQYTILAATGGLSGTFNPAVISSNSNLSGTLSYDPNDVFLNVKLNFAIPGGLSGDQQAVGNALTNFFNTTGGIPAVFAMLSSAGLAQASGELATGSQQTTFNAMNQFMGVLTDPFVAGRGDGPSVGGGSTNGYADADALGYAGTRNPNDARAAIYTKAPPIIPFEQRWSTWVAGYGGSQSTDGNAALGSNNTTSSVYGTAVGADYRISPFTLAGFALAGGGTSFSVNGSGSGHSDLFQAGAFIRHNVGPLYISAALAYGWQDITTDRIVSIAGSDHLRAEFNANAFSGRLEGGYRFVTPWIGGLGITPYAAGQFTTFDLPSYAESALSGSNAFALGYGAQSVTDARSELGIRTDKSFAVQDGIFTLRGRFAWAHDYDPDRSIAATFQALPGASFVVNGAAQASDSALTTVSAEMKWTNGWSVAATFEGEFSDVTASYAGKGVARYSW